MKLILRSIAMVGLVTLLSSYIGVAIADDSDKKLAILKKGVRLQDLVDGLNALGIGPRDMISILQAIKAAGALQADIELM